MNRFSYPFVIGSKGDRLKCQLKNTIPNGGKTIYVFLMEATGDTYAIQKINNEWNFVDGGLHLDSWIQELGNYVDENNI